MIIKNCNLLNENFVFFNSSIRITDERITEISNNIIPRDDEVVIDADFKKVIPGLIDIHTHGSCGFDTCDNSYEGLEKITEYMADNGITSYMPTTMTLDVETLSSIMKTVSKFKKEQKRGCYIQGIYMEGPYFSMAKKGAQNGDYIMNPDFEHFMRLYKDSGEIIKVVALASEIEGAIDFIKRAKDICTVAIGHTNGTYDTTNAAINNGASHATHLYNGMPGFNHRDPSVVGAVIDSNCTAELICDGIHIHSAIIRNTFRALGEDRLVLVSDSMKACGMPDGLYDLGGQEVIVKGTTATLKDGTLAGSATNLMGCVRKAYEFGIPFESAVKAATLNPAKVIGVDKDCGSIKEGKIADLVILNNDLSINKVIIKGKIHK